MKLRTIRRVLAVVFFAAVTLLFLDFTGTLHAWLGWTARVQFLPALLALNVGVVALLVLLTLGLGRVYCSVICPLGVMQDVFAWMGRRQKKNRYTHSPALTWLRWSVLAVFVLALVAGVGSLVALLAPYSSYGRMASNLLAPLYAWGNNLLAYAAERADSYAFYETEVWMKSLPTFLIALFSFIIIGVLAWRGGRTYCNTICPVGTVLGFLARFSWLKPVVDADRCVGCKLCERNCKASCIDIAHHQIDYSRCVACMNCIETCYKGAISYKHPVKKAAAVPDEAGAADGPADGGRRTFLTATAMAACPESAGEKGGRRLGRHRGQAGAPPRGAARAGGSVERAAFCPPLHRLPALRVGLPERRAAPGHRPGAAHAARDELRAGLLPAGVYEVCRCVPGGSDPPDYGGREIVYADWPRRVGQAKLRAAD